jgi:hypothetical protein
VLARLLRKVDDLHRVIAQRRDVQPLPFRVGGEVVEAAFDAGQRDRADRPQRPRVVARLLLLTGFLLARSGLTSHGRKCGKQGRKPRRNGRSSHGASCRVRS